MIDQREVIEGKDLLEIFKCMKCHSIPIQPIKECGKCESLICEKCFIEGPSGIQKCYSCHKHMYQVRGINRQLMIMIENKLRFKHVCSSSKAQVTVEIRNNDTNDKIASMIIRIDNVIEKPKVEEAI